VYWLPVYIPPDTAIWFISPPPSLFVESRAAIQDLNLWSTILTPQSPTFPWTSSLSKRPSTKTRLMTQSPTFPQIVTLSQHLETLTIQWISLCCLLLPPYLIRKIVRGPHMSSGNKLVHHIPNDSRGMRAHYPPTSTLTSSQVARALHSPCQRH